MEYSVQAYLERRTSVELINFLEMCRLRNEWDQYADTVPDILRLLHKRNVQMPEKIMEAWNEFLGQTQKTE